MEVGGGLITAVAAAIGSAIAPAAQRGRVLTSFAGLIVSQALGMPLGAWRTRTQAPMAATVVMARSRASRHDPTRRWLRWCCGITAMRLSLSPAPHCRPWVWCH
jgi:hypothetical protein